MSCCCLLPSCDLCFPASSGTGAATSGCTCCLPSCARCWKDGACWAARSPKLSGSGVHMSAHMKAIIATVYERLKGVLDEPPDSPQAYLRRGAGWQALATTHTSSPPGSREEHLVAYLCGVGVTTVQAARASSREAKSMGSFMPAEPSVRGVKPAAPCLLEKPRLLAGPGEPGADAQGSGDLWAPAGFQVLGNVPGHYVKASLENPEAHSTALVLGRLYTICGVHNLADHTCQVILSLLHSVGVCVGQKHHSRAAVSAFQGILARLCGEGARQQFELGPRNLPFPSAWRLVFDGVTLPNGVTLTVVLVVHTTGGGDIEVTFLGCARCGASSVAQEQAASVQEVLNRTLGLSTAKATCKGTLGLPLACPPAASSRGQIDVHRGLLLACMPCDRAYCGRTGTGADAVLSEKLGVRGLLGLTRRVGMADLFHCYDSSAKFLVSTGVDDNGGDSNGSEDASSTASEGEGGGSPLASWIRLCRRLRATLGRGQGNFHLGEAYAAKGIRGRPKVGVPGGTRMIVYSAAFLEQSFAHFPARYEAMWAYSEFTKAQSEDAKSKGRGRYRKKWQKLQRIGAGLANASLVAQALLLHTCLTASGGFIEGAKQVQATVAPFWPLHLASRRVLWQLRHLGLLPPSLVRLAKAQCSPIASTREGAAGSRVAWHRALRCRVCGFVAGQRVFMLEHVKECHLDKRGAPRRNNITEELLLTPAEILRPGAVASNFPPRVPVVSRNPIDCLALRHRGAIVPSLWEVEGCLRMFQTLTSFASFATGSGARPCSLAGPAPTMLDCFAFLLATLGSREVVSMWRLARPFWTFFCGYAAHGSWQGCSVEAFRRPVPDVGPLIRCRSQEAFSRACDNTLSAVGAVRRCMAELSASFEDQVIHSHGDHVPLAVRNAATVLWWLPEVLEWARYEDVSQGGWQLAFKSLQPVLAYVSNQLSVYDWPTEGEAMVQYKRLVCRWSELLQQDDIAAQALPKGQKRAFVWKAWWKMAHREPRFCPSGCEAAFALFHFTGMLGVSEAQAESVASLLKRYSPKCASRLATDRVVEKTLLRLSGVCGDGSDDRLLLRAWVEFFGGMEADQFCFAFRNSKRRATSLPLGAGSMVIHRHLKRRHAARRWQDAQALRRMPRIGVKDGVVARSTDRWLRHLARRS